MLEKNHFEIREADDDGSGKFVRLNTAMRKPWPQEDSFLTAQTMRPSLTLSARRRKIGCNGFLVKASVPAVKLTSHAGGVVGALNDASN